MGLEIGIVGLPNVGKSTLFNALLKKQAALAANYPFATIEPNIGIVEVPDARLAILADVVKTTKIVPAVVKFVDIAGLVKGASQGAGLGNKFLAHIREVDAICYVLRDFGDANIIREGSVDPQSDLGLLRLELQLADEQTIENQNSKLKTQSSKANGKNLQPLRLLRDKPEIVVFNVDENFFNNTPLHPPLNLRGGPERVIHVSAKMEEELAGLSGEEQKQYLANLGIAESGLEKVIRAAYEILGLQSFLTAGEKEVRAWTIKMGTKAPQAAGVIHGDFEKNFIKAEVVDYEEFVKCGGWKGAREAGKARLEGRDYVMGEGDVVEFKVGV
jgi:ribosome-binding ATPase YchF (GTP1/OBG family)